jgi:exopolysaccharide biosynthesis polyprenyl glycosylphosphotransferase
VGLAAPLSTVEEKQGPAATGLADAGEPIAGGWRLWHALESRRDLVVGPLAGAIVLGLLARPGNAIDTVLLALAAFAGGAALGRRVAPQAALLPLMRRVQPLLGPALAVGGLALLELLTGEPRATPLDLLAAFVAASLPDRPLRTLRGAPRATGVRAAYIGRPAAAERLARALEAGGSNQYQLVGRVIGIDEARDPVQAEAGVPALGTLDELAGLVVEHHIDLLVMGGEAPRLAVFSQMTEHCLDLPVRLVELSGLFEEAFGHVPTAEINPAWFQCLADPQLRLSTSPIKRTIDLVLAGTLLVLTAPLLGVLILLIRRDGGPGLFRQVRIGERGRRFKVCKLRTMVVGADATAQWAAPEDPRITRLGALLRKTHFDELPQLINVVRGEMSLVGPRPEQPEFVDRLERSLPFYQRRHLMRPGITGWAQIRCGYAGSDIGSAWKLCHDLYYAKHRSAGVDLLILCETVANLFFAREDVLQPETVAFVLAEERR